MTAQTRIQRGETLSLALEMVSGDLTGATCAISLKRSVNGKAPADDAPVLIDLNVVYVPNLVADDGQSSPGWIGTGYGTEALEPDNYSADARIVFAGRVIQADKVTVVVDSRVTTGTTPVTAPEPVPGSDIATPSGRPADEPIVLRWRTSSKMTNPAAAVIAPPSSTVAGRIAFDDTLTALGVTNVQDAIVALYALLGSNPPVVTPVLLSGALMGSSALAGALSVTRALSAQATGSGVLTASLTVEREGLSGTVVAAGLLTGSLQVTRALIGAIEGTSAVAGALSVTRALAGTAYGMGAMTGALTVESVATTPPADWRMPATVTASPDLSGSVTALNTASATSSAKTRPTVIVASGATSWIEWTVAEAGLALVSFAGVSFGTFSFAVSLDDVDQAFAPALPDGEPLNYRRQGMLLPVTAGQVIRLTMTAVDSALTAYPMLHKKPATGPWDGHLAIGASRENDIHRSPVMEAAVVAAFSTRDPIIFPYTRGGYTLSAIAGHTDDAVAAFSDMAKYVYVGSAAGNTISALRPWESSQTAGVTADYQTMLDLFDGAGMVSTFASNRYGQYEAGLPADQSLGSLPYNNNVLAPFLAAQLPDAYDAALNTAQADAYLLTLRHRDKMEDAVHGTSEQYALERVLIADTWYRRIYTGSWSHTPQAEQRIIDLEVNQTSEANAKFSLDEAVLAMAALTATAAKTALVARLDAAQPTALFYEAKRLIGVAESAQTAPNKTAAQDALDAASTAGFAGAVAPNTIAEQQARIDAIVIAAFDQIINIDLGGAVDIAGWNETGATTSAGVVLPNMIDSTGATTGTTMTMVSARLPNGVAVNSGLVSAVDGIPDSALARTWWRGDSSIDALIGGLDPARQYDVVMMASRSSSYQPTRFAVNGIDQSPDQNGTNNVTVATTASAVSPDGSGQILVNARRPTASSNYAFTVIQIKRRS